MTRPLRAQEIHFLCPQALAYASYRRNPTTKESPDWRTWSWRLPSQVPVRVVQALGGVQIEAVEVAHAFRVQMGRHLLQTLLVAFVSDGCHPAVAPGIGREGQNVLARLEQPPGADSG